MVGPPPSQRAIAITTLTERVIRHPIFVESRAELRLVTPRVGALRSVIADKPHYIEDIDEFDDFPVITREDLGITEDDAREIIRVSAQLARRFSYDRVPNGTQLLTQALLSADAPDVASIGDHSWIPVVWVALNGDEFPIGLKEPPALPAATWRRVRRWSVSELFVRVDLLFRRIGNLESAQQIAEDVNADERTVRRWIGDVEKLIGMSAQQGRPRKVGD